MYQVRERVHGMQGATMMRGAPPILSRLVRLSLDLDADDEVDYQQFLAGMEAAAEELGLEKASRRYRKDFNRSYATLFPDDTRRYRCDILQAALEGAPSMLVNGVEQSFSSDTKALAASLADVWAKLHAYLMKLEAPAGPWRCLETLTRLDATWAAFEHSYVLELMAVEQACREPFESACNLQLQLQSMEARFGVPLEGPERYRSQMLLQSHQEYAFVQEQLVRSISRLNALANVRGKGRADLDPRLLREALASLESDVKEPICCLATKVVESFEVMRQYLSEAASCMEMVDPELSRNERLLDRLEDWEECWEVASSYLLRPHRCAALCFLVRQLKKVCSTSPAFRSMCEECSAEVFLALPRLVVLLLLKDTAQGFKLLQPYFRQSASFDLVALAQQLEAIHDAMGEQREATNQLFVEHAICGMSEDVAVKGVLVPLDAVTESIRRFTRDLERWSMALQREKASEWNSFVTVLMQCLGFI